MKALIQNNTVIQLSETIFEVHSDLQWVDANEDCQVGYTYNDEVFSNTNPSPVVRTYAENRAREYPPITDYLDGIVKNDQAQIDAYIEACQAVKNKYPKP
jgi:hypothetical protein